LQYQHCLALCKKATQQLNFSNDGDTVLIRVPPALRSN